MKPTDPKTWPVHMQNALSAEEKIRCGILPGVVAPAIATEQKPAKPVAKGMNKTEAEYFRILEAKVRSGEFKTVYPHESIKFKIGDTRCWYTPDFVIVTATGEHEVHEVKGAHVWDDARVKYQSAIRQYPSIKWVWAQKIKGNWEIQ